MSLYWVDPPMDLIDHTTRDGPQSPNEGRLRCSEVRRNWVVTNCLAAELDSWNNNSPPKSVNVSVSVSLNAAFSTAWTSTRAGQYAAARQPTLTLKPPGVQHEGKASIGSTLRTSPSIEGRNACQHQRPSSRLKRPRQPETKAVGSFLHVHCALLLAPCSFRLTVTSSGLDKQSGGRIVDTKATSDQALTRLHSSRFAITLIFD
ncbi:hypothetical protein, variant [Phialophora macrospora]|uniref:Uncharacterized protein n=1 Tax=Phialophora macrospora TaxID=1851006 RepID=A0A0D2DUA2_9EURO|nr:hypothetical protein PV04_07913 [Phialophora macrospora]KIW65677.1 hypothetical protein, variant [Phialophora macrospora]